MAVNAGNSAGLGNRQQHRIEKSAAGSILVLVADTFARSLIQ